MTGDPIVVPASDLIVGDIVDLYADPFADPDAPYGANSLWFDSEYVQVVEVTRETDDCVAVGFEGFDLVGFPPDHRLTIKRSSDEQH